MPKLIVSKKVNVKEADNPKYPKFPDRPLEHLNSGNAISYYTNSVQVVSSVWDIRLRCGEMTEASREKIVIKELCNIYMSPSHAKALSIILARKVKEYEEMFGEVPVPPV